LWANGEVLRDEAANSAAPQVPADTSVDQTGATNALRRTYLGVSDRSALGISACARMSM
jgi:hypothetical protein